MRYFPERLKAARKMKGFSLQDLAGAVQNKWNKQYLNRLENGEAKPDSETLIILSKALEVTSDYFFRESTISLEDIRFRKLKKLPVKEQEKVIHRTVEYLERYLEVEDLLGIENTITFKAKGRKVSNPADVEQAARELREIWKLGIDAIFNVIEMLEENHIKVLPLKVNTSFSGMSTIIKNLIPVVVLNEIPEIPVVRRRFTALHELAHLYLDLSGYEEKESEKLCDQFAGAMLLPAEKLKQYFGQKRTHVIMKELYMIAADYGISLAAIMYRAMSLGIISPSYHKFFMINYNRYKTREKEFKVFCGEEKSDRFLQLLIKGIAEEVISTTKAAALNNQKLGEFRKILDNTVT
ncbi:MAG: helix-turn-helix domain-containing protein [Ginsengibacter sp.]